jgi:hypothetical protein
MKRVGWFLFTIIIGLIPFLLRVLIFLIFKSDENILSFIINETDFIILGLIINITNLLQLKDINLSSKNFGDTITKEYTWISISFLITFLCIIIFSGILFFSYLYRLGINLNILNLFLLKISSIILSVISILFGFFIIDRVNNIENQILLSNRKKEII